MKLKLVLLLMLLAGVCRGDMSDDIMEMVKPIKECIDTLAIEIGKNRGTSNVIEMRLDDLEYRIKKIEEKIDNCIWFDIEFSTKPHIPEMTIHGLQQIKELGNSHETK